MKCYNFAVVVVAVVVVAVVVVAVVVGAVVVGAVVVGAVAAADFEPKAHSWPGAAREVDSLHTPR